MRVLTEISVVELFGSDVTAQCCLRSFGEVFPVTNTENKGMQVTRIELPDALYVRKHRNGKIEYLIEDHELSHQFADFAEEYF